jgi:hypothetical protein
VGDGVVQLAGDPLPLGGGRLVRPLVRRALHLQRRVVAPSRDPAHEPDAAGEHERGQHVRRGVAAGAGLRRDGDGEDEQPVAEQRVAQRAVGGHGVDGDDRGDGERVDLQRRAGERAPGPRAEDDRGDDERRAATVGQAGAWRVRPRRG